LLWLSRSAWFSWFVFYKNCCDCNTTTTTTKNKHAPFRYFLQGKSKSEKITTKTAASLSRSGEKEVKLSFSNGIFCEKKLDQNIAAVKSLGFENLEFNLKTIEPRNDMAAYEVKKLIKEHGLNCLTVHAATLPVTDVVEVHRAVYYGKLSADLTYLLGAPVMVVHSNVSYLLDFAHRTRLLKEIFKEITPYAENLGITLALENLSYPSMGFGKNVAELKEIFSAIVDPNMGVTLDFCHASAIGVTQSLLETYHNRLRNIHLSSLMHEPLLEETPPLRDFMTQLAQYHYAGPVTLELNRKCTTAQILQTKTVVEKLMDKVESRESF
jgi:sugar phosphate isomerase/epimerase